MIITGYVSFERFINNSDNHQNKSISLPLGNNGWLSLEYSTIENNRWLSSVIIANILSDFSIDKSSSVLPGTELFSYDDIKKRLQSDQATPIELSICFSQADRKITLTRGLFGSIPLFYIHQSQRFFCFSTSLKALTELDFIRPLLSKDDSSIANFLSIRGLSDSYSTETFYQPVSKVLPGHELTVSPSGIQTNPYTRFNIKQWSLLKSKEEYSEIFRSLFEISLKNTIGDEKLIGAHLSGGLDSSSISATTKHLFPNRILHTFFGQTNTADTDEGHYALDVSKKINSIHHVIDAPNDEIDKTVLHTSIYANPLQLIHSPARQNGLIQAIKNTGCRMILSGEGGDGIVGYGMEYLNELLADQKWTEVKSVFAQMSSLIQQAVYHPNWPNLATERKQQLYARETLYKILVRKFRSLSLTQFSEIAYSICKEFGISPFFFFGRGARNFFIRQTNQDSILSKNFLEQEKQFKQKSIANLAKILYHGVQEETQNAYGSLYNASSIAVREDTYALSNHYEVSTYFPFYNKALLEISMATPALFKYDNGLRRGHLRDAMKGLLPENVRLRFGKAAFDQFAIQSALRLNKQSQDFLMDNSTVWDYVDKKKFNALVNKLKQENEMTSVYTYTYLYINKVIFLSVWLDWYKNNIR